MNEIIAKIKERGYWRIVVRPAKSFYKDNYFEINDIAKKLESCQVRLRGWYYPHIDTQKVAITAQDRVSGLCDWQEFLEYWDCTKSGQFSHIANMREDYSLDEAKIEKIKKGFAFSKDKVEEATRLLEAVNCIHFVTEIYRFISDFVRLQEFENVKNFNAQISLHGVRGRMLYVSDFRRSLWQPYVCSIHSDVINFDNTYSKEELIASFSHHAQDIIIKIFHYFGWLDPNKQIISEDQQKLLERRL